MATKPKRRTNSANKTINRKRSQRKIDRHHHHVQQNPMAVDDVIHQILPLLATKSAVRMSSLSKQWQAVWFSLSVLNFDEGDPPPSDDNNKNLRHKNFIKILNRYCRNVKHKKLLEKFRLRMTRFILANDSAVVDKCLMSFAIRTSLKELDFSLRPNYSPFLYCIPIHTLLDAESLTTLSLEFVRIKFSVDDNISYDDLKPLPCLKSLSLKNVSLAPEALSILVSGCPSIEYLSLCSCFSIHGLRLLRIEVSSIAKSVTTLNLEALKVNVSTSDDDLEILPALKTMSLKSVQLTSEALSRFIAGCSSLEYLSLSAWSVHSKFDHSDVLRLQVSSSSLKSLYITNDNFEDVRIFRCRNLKYINIHTHRLRFWSCGSSVKETRIDITKCVHADIHLMDEEAAFMDAMEYFSALRDFLESFNACAKLSLHVHDAGALIFPENFRNCSSPPVSCILNLQVSIESPNDARDSDLRDSLKWMAHPVIQSIQYQNED